MTKVQLKSDKVTPFGGIFAVMSKFTDTLEDTIDSTLGLRCTSYGFQYSEIIRSLMCAFFCGGSCVEDVTSHLMPHLSLHPRFRTCSADTILRAIKELAVKNTTYASDAGIEYHFNTADLLNGLLLNALIRTGQLEKGKEYDLDFDHQYIETEKYDCLPTYKKFLGYGPGVAVIGNIIVGIENRDGNTNVRFHQEDTLGRFFQRLEEKGVSINRFRADCGSYSEKIIAMVEKHCRTFYIRAINSSSLYDGISSLENWNKVRINELDLEVTSIPIKKWGKDYRLVIQRQKRTDGEQELWEGGYTYRCIITNDQEMSAKEVVEFYNLRGGKERIFDEMNNDFGWNRLPKSYMSENTAYLLLTALIRNFYKALMQDEKMESFGLKSTSRMKSFVFRFISVPAKWIRRGRQSILNIYTDNKSYQNIFNMTCG